MTQHIDVVNAVPRQPEAQFTSANHVNIVSCQPDELDELEYDEQLKDFDEFDKFVKTDNIEIQDCLDDGYVLNMDITTTNNIDDTLPINIQRFASDDDLIEYMDDDMVIIQFG